MIDWSFDAWPAIVPAWHVGANVDEREYHVDLGCGTVKKGRIGVDRYPAPGVNVVMDLNRGLVAAAAPRPGRDAAERLGNGWRFRTPFGRLTPRNGYEGGETDYLDYPIPTPPEFGPFSGYRCAQRICEAYCIGRGLPFEDSSIESIISHHALEHIGEGFIPLMDDIYRVLKPGGIFTGITPLFPSATAVADPDHCRYFMEDTWLSFCGSHLGDENNPTGSWLDSFSVPYTSARFKILSLETTPRCAPEKHWTSEDSRELRVTLEAVK